MEFIDPAIQRQYDSLIFEKSQLLEEIEEIDEQLNEMKEHEERA